MKKLVVVLILFVVSIPHYSYAAHTFEPLRTEIASTPPRGGFFLQVIYNFLHTEDGSDEIDEHLLPVEIEYGLTERTQLNLESEVLIAEIENGDTEERGIEKIGIGIKHRFFDETATLPDMAFEIEAAPVAEVGGDAQAIGGTLIFSKFLGTNFIGHANVGYEFEREEEDDEEEFINVFFYNLALAFRAVPERLLLIGELNAEHEFVEDGPTIDVISVTPQIIALPISGTQLAVKLGVPIGLTNGRETPDIGFSGGISVLFQ